MAAPFVDELIDHRPGITAAVRRRRGLSDADTSADLTPEEFTVLLELAQRADPKTRECFGGADTFARLFGIGDKSNNRRKFDALADKGYEVRVPVGQKKDGSPLYANRHHAATFRFPELCKSPGADGFHDRALCFPGERSTIGAVEAGAVDAPPVDADELAPAAFVTDIRDIRARVNADTLRMWSAAHIGRALAEAVRRGAPDSEAREALRDMAGRAYVKAPGFLTGSNAGMEADWFTLARRNRAGTAAADVSAVKLGPPQCDFSDDGSGHCTKCTLPKPNARHLGTPLPTAEPAGTVLPFPAGRAKRPA
ncbi:hypothetical protein JIG36_51005 [Actinoplanes sp. LDG1-06]|uniref:Uncharacterized protein n=1 Tax=Paractinoplanes ovalisporus TaxID=2810368 RepID=A0ABS2AVF4_9ACTN|nr:helix-turn-helix domain-containing protein [Actinoplanes ovalisporus]MBM2623849.1 hypothetical protein [Actinoplanes ovalisporus]